MGCLEKNDQCSRPNDQGISQCINGKVRGCGRWGTVQIARWFLATNQDGLEAEFERPFLIRTLPKTPELDMFLTIDDMGASLA